jgi:hypothetical protein
MVDLEVVSIEVGLDNSFWRLFSARVCLAATASDG